MAELVATLPLLVLLDATGDTYKYLQTRLLGLAPEVARLSC